MKQIGSDQAPRCYVDESFAATLRFLVSVKLSESNMQERELNRVTIGVVNSMDLRGRATADEINRGLRTGKHPARIGGLAAFIAAGVFVALVPMPTRADDDERGGHKETEALEAKVASLQTAVSALQ